MVWTKAYILDLLQKASDAGVEIKLTDSQIADSIFYDKQPGSDIGLNIMQNVSRVISQQGDKKAPCRYKVFEKQFPEKKMEIYLFANEGNLCGKDSLNCLYVHSESIYSVPPTGGDYDNIRKQGIRSLCLADCFSALVASRAESISGDYEVVEMNLAKSFDEMNIKIPEFLKKYLSKKDLFLNNEINCKAEIKMF